MTTEPTPRETLLVLALVEKTRIAEKIVELHDRDGLSNMRRYWNDKMQRITEAINWLDARGAGER